MTIDDNEIEINIALEQAIEAIGYKKNNILYFFGRIFQYADEPSFFSYNSQLNNSLTDKTPADGSASGFSFFSQKLAVLKCLLEALERYALKHYDKKDVIFSTTDKLDKSFVDPTTIASFSDKQRKENKNLKLNVNGLYGWILGKKLPSLEDIYIPAQLIYFSYRRQLGEGLIRLPISTGAASGTANSAAIYRGLCEAIERDAFMITYLNKLPRSKIPLHKSKNTKIKKIIEMVDNCNLQINSFDISTDIGVYVFLTTIYDGTGISSAISVGMKGGLDPIETLLGSMQEAFHSRAWIRNKKDQFTGKKSDLMKPPDLLERALLWSSLDSVKNLDFLLNSTKETVNIDDYKDKSNNSSAKDLSKTIELLRDRGYESYFVDITPDLPSIKNTKFKVVMTIVPELQPLYLNEQYQYLGGARLYEIPVKLGYLKKSNNQSNLHKFPHPFL
ncbi:MAG: YcaO-like family protein [Candidatus Levybacteria bacterium]|nr:YcaO-like family protein [Candidatus Levybacteria bacterium]